MREHYKKYGEIKECYEDEGGDLEYLKTNYSFISFKHEIISFLKISKFKAKINLKFIKRFKYL